jgi:hypothetical protein
MRTTVDVLNAPAGFGNAQVNLVTAQHDRVVASASRLSPQTLGLPTSPCTGRDLFTRCATRAGDGRQHQLQRGYAQDDARIWRRIRRPPESTALSYYFLEHKASGLAHG